MTKKYALIILGLWAAAAPARAVPPGPGVTAPEGRTCNVNQAALEARVTSLRTARAQGLFSAPPALLTPRVLVLRVSFSNKAVTKTIVETDAFFGRVRDFYIENSYSVFRPTFTVSNTGGGAEGSFLLAATMETYGADCGGDVSCNDLALFNAAVSAAQGTTNFNQFDHIMIYHAGDGQESTGIDGDIWSLYYGGTVLAAAKSFPGFTIVPDTEAGSVDPLGVICHEYGHQQGLPDLYDVSASGGESTVGAWSLMDWPYTTDAPVNPLGSNPPHLGAWDKKFLGFVPETAATASLSLGPVEVPLNGYVKIPIPTAASTEYFLVEYRLRASGATYDKGIAMDGLVIWHIDDAIALDAQILNNNVVNTPSLSGRGHRGVEVVEADGTGPAPPANVGTGDAFGNGTFFTAPQSNTFAGAASVVSITNIAGIGTTQATGSVLTILAATAPSIKKVVNYPNPGGDPGRYPTRPGAAPGTVTTLVLQLGKPVGAGNLQLDIYDLAGTIVRRVAGSDLILKTGAGEQSSDYKWVYEFDWNGVNDDGKDVVPGVYLYRFKVGDNTKVGKMAIVR
jgi:M6 family metalloprotease-like protein